MTLRLRALRLVARTGGGRFERDISFGDGLNIIRADNTHGKSTIMASIIYALGLEAMLDARHEVPLPPAMTDTIRDAYDREHHVDESFVILEIENSAGQRLTCQRWVTHEEINRHLVRTWPGPVLTSTMAYPEEDFFVRRPGAAQSDRGFHHMLADFLGWELPAIVREDGTEAPLYLEMIFPLIYVEQKRGWGGIQATMPTFGIPNARRRALEFLLDLGVYRRVQARTEFQAALDRVKTDYRRRVAAFGGQIASVGVIVQGLSNDLPTSWPEVAPTVLASGDEQSWISLQQFLSLLRGRLTELVEQELPSVEAASDELEEGLRQDEKLVERLIAAASEIRDSVAADEDQLRTLEQRLTDLEEDRRRYRDALTLHNLGSPETHALTAEECPACHQQLPVAFLVAAAPPPMSLEENLDFISAQVRTFEIMRGEAERRRDVGLQKLTAIGTRVKELRRGIRATRSTLVSPNTFPSAAAIRERVSLEDKIEALDELERGFLGLLEELQPLVEQGARLRRSIQDLPTERLDDQDEAKLQALETALVNQLSEYGFRSFPVDTIGISRENYLPTREGFDLGFVTSASDAIRIVWAYLIALLEVDRLHATNHPGLLVFDEPRQQSADQLSFEALLRHAVQAASGRQIVFATSEPDESLTAYLSGQDFTKTIIEGMALEFAPEE